MVADQPKDATAEEFPNTPMNRSLDGTGSDIHNGEIDRTITTLKITLSAMTKTTTYWRRGRAPGTGRNVRRWKRFRSTLALRSIVGNNVGGKESHGCLHSFAFLSGKKK